jgi:hypothetical protein
MHRETLPVPGAQSLDTGVVFSIERVTLFGHPAAAAAFGDKPQPHVVRMNWSRRRVRTASGMGWWCTTGQGPIPGATMKVQC